MSQSDDLKQLGPYHAIASIWNMILQHGSATKIADDAVANNFMVKNLGIDLQQAEHVRAAIDLIEDTGSAFGEVRRNGLYVHRQPLNPGEVYLRLYGVLNAAYLITGAISQLANFFMSHGQGDLVKSLQREPFYELRNRLGAHPLDFRGAQRIHHRVAQVGMYNLDGKRSYVSSDMGYQEVDIMDALVRFEQACLSALLVLTEYKAAKVIKRTSVHHQWVDESFEFVRGTLSSPHPKTAPLP